MSLFSAAYYRYVFLRNGCISRVIESIVGRPQVPSKDIWERQYASGCWERLRSLTERAHNAVVLSYATISEPEPTILEIGCGEGILLRHLQKLGYSHYTGIDISERAIGSCKALANERTRFIACDAEHYELGSKVNVIILNESLYYFHQPIEALRRYLQWLAPEGVVVISLFDKNRTRSIRRRLHDSFQVLDETVVSNSGGTWYCLLLGSSR